MFCSWFFFPFLCFPCALDPGKRGRPVVIVLGVRWDCWLYEHGLSGIWRSTISKIMGATNIEHQGDRKWSAATGEVNSCLLHVFSFAFFFLCAGMWGWSWRGGNIHGEGRALRINESWLPYDNAVGGRRATLFALFLSFCRKHGLHANGTRCISQF